MKELEDEILEQAKTEWMLDDGDGLVKRMERFMDKYGYRDGAGWWVKNKCMKEKVKGV